MKHTRDVRPASCEITWDVGVVRSMQVGENKKIPVALPLTQAVAAVIVCDAPLVAVLENDSIPLRFLLLVLLRRVRVDILPPLERFL